MATLTLTPTSTLLLLCIFYGFLWISLCFHPNRPTLQALETAGVDVRNPVVDVVPAPISGPSEDVIYCGRVPVSGVSRLKLQHYASVYRVTLVPSVLIPKQWQNKIQVCFHRNSSVGLCQCEKDDWRSLQNGLWSSTMAPYVQSYVDVKFDDVVTGSVTVSLDEVQQGWRYILLAVGFVLLFLAPVVSEWVPFYYTSSMAIGILAVVLILFYQARKLLPTGRRNAFYLGIMSSVLGAGSFVVRNLSAFLNSFLQNFGISKEVQSPVYVFVVLGIIILGAGLGYWLVRRYIISEDGEVDVGVAQFIKWSIRIVAVTCIFLSTNDTPLAMVAVGSCLALYHVITKLKRQSDQAQSYSGRGNIWGWSKQTTPKHGHAESLSRSKKNTPSGSPWNGARNSFAWSNSPIKSKVSPLTNSGSIGSQHDVYSTFHKTPNRKKFSKKEWEEFTEESTRQSVAELASSREFTDWVIENADRIKLLPADCSEDVDASGSSDSTDECEQQSRTGQGFFNWQMRK
ncbi:hypothetical protein OSB04_026976 [Centaurea solstitialis]|uniref:Uncharacterized protein n=1 Tax=Centaurea solstitialis TaxID=347529 RepID=A0AA38W6D9_9ASTR|nr:hypothetical protein OSB04_026976 [Centaurea solstitialis]